MTDTAPPAGTLEWLANSELILAIYLSGIETGIATTLINCTDATEEEAARSRANLMASLTGDPIAFEQTRSMIADYVRHGKPVRARHIKAYVVPNSGDFE
jgi:hypothetical protein